MAVSSESTTSHLLPETSAILSLLRQLNVQPRTLPETHDILALLHQLHGPVSAVSPPPASAMATAVDAPLQPSPEIHSTTAPDLSFGSAFDGTQPQDGFPQPENLSVRAFFNAVPWDHIPQTRPTSEQPALQSPEPEDGFPVVVKTSAEPPMPPAPDHDRMTLSVRAFFAGVNWDQPLGETQSSRQATAVIAGAAV